MLCAFSNDYLEQDPKLPKPILVESSEFVFCGLVLSYGVFVSPLLLYSIKAKNHFALTADIPVFKYYNGIQFMIKFSVAVNYTRYFSLKKEK